MFLGEDLLAWLVLAMGASMAAGNLAALVRPRPQRRDPTDLERAPLGRSLLYIAIGSVAAVWSADGQALAFGSTARPGSLLFSSLQILDLSTGRIASLLDETDRALTGFFWSPRGDALLYLSVDVRHSHLRWHQLSRPSGKTRELVRFLPSREQTFILSFFDQYASSHPPIAPDGSALAFAGHRVGPVALDTGSLARVYIVSLNETDAPPAIRAVGTGNFVCWEPPRNRA